MTIREKAKRRATEPSQESVPRPLCARDRLLAALKIAPRLRHEEAERINRVVREAREASIADGLPD